MSNHEHSCVLGAAINTQTKNPQHIAVVGAGLIGRIIALELHRLGHQITLLDKDCKNGKQSSAYAAAGLLAPLGEAFHANSSIVDMGFESLNLWPKFLATLDEPVFFQREGTLMVSHEQDKGDFDRHHRFLLRHYPQHDIQTLNRQTLTTLEPELGRAFNQGIYLPEEGQIGNRRLLKALQFQLEKEGIRWLEHSPVNRFSLANNKMMIEHQNKDNKQTLNVDLVIDCRGIGACSSQLADKTRAQKSINSVTNQSPLSELRAVRGELFQLFAPEVNISRPIRLMHPRYQLYIAPKGRGYYVVGATEIESEDMSPMTVRSAMELLSAAYSVHSGFAEANIRQHVSHCRPAFNNNEPKIIEQERLLQVNGLYRHGFLIAPVIVEQVKAKIAAFVQAN